MGNSIDDLALGVSIGQVDRNVGVRGVRFHPWCHVAGGYLCECFGTGDRPA